MKNFLLPRPSRSPAVFRILVLIGILSVSVQTPPAFAFNGKLEKADTTTFGTPRKKDVNGVAKPGCETTEMKSAKGEVLAKLCKKDFKECKDEGSCVVKTENGQKLFNVTASGGKAWKEIDQKTCKYGTGGALNGKTTCLIPYKSLACPPGTPVGKVIHMPRAVGKHYQVDGGPIQVHDGNFVCSDSGKDIVGAGRFDVFTGYKDDPKNEFLNAGFDDRKTRPDFAEVIGGKISDDDLLIQNMKELLFTSGEVPAVGAVAQRSSASAR